MQQGDVKLFQTSDGGEINVTGGLVEMGGGLETTVYLSLFGGNEDDDGLASSPYDWWGNTAELETNKMYRSETQNLLEALPLTSNSLKRVEDAAGRDLSWLVGAGVATKVTVLASVPKLNTLKLNISVDQSKFEFIENWRAQ